MIAMYSPNRYRIIQVLVFGLGVALPLVIVLFRNWHVLVTRILTVVR